MLKQVTNICFLTAGRIVQDLFGRHHPKGAHQWECSRSVQDCLPTPTRRWEDLDFPFHLGTSWRPCSYERVQGAHGQQSQLGDGLHGQVKETSHAIRLVFPPLVSHFHNLSYEIVLCILCKIFFFSFHVVKKWRKGLFHLQLCKFQFESTKLLYLMC